MLSLPLTVIVVAVGVLIGGVGIGGVLLVPSLKYLGGIELHSAIPACMMAYIVTGLIGAIIFERHGTINWSLAKIVCLGALPGAFLGAYLLPFISANALEMGIAILLLASGFDSLFKTESTQINTVSNSTVLLFFIGVITGLGSALTGTGGPLLLIPILVWRGLPILTAIGLAQAVQVPISLMATTGNILYGDLDIRLGILLALTLAGGAVLGAKIAHVIAINFLKKLVSCLLVAVGLTMLYRLIF